MSGDVESGIHLLGSKVDTEMVIGQLGSPANICYNADTVNQYSHR